MNTLDTYDSGYDNSRLNERVLGLINNARLALVLALLVFHIVGTYSDLQLQQFSFPPLPFYAWITAYSILILLSIFRPDWQWRALDVPSASSVTDISMMVGLMYIAGGVSSGFGILVLPFVVTSCLLNNGRHPLLFAGYTSILLIFNLPLFGSLHFAPFFYASKEITATFLLIGASYLAALLTSFAARYLQHAADAAAQNRLAFSRISGLNRLVLDRVQETVIVIDPAKRIWLFNKQAKIHFPNLAAEQQEAEFAELVQRWQQLPEQAFEADIPLFGIDMHIRAVPLIQEQTELLMLYARPQREVEAEARSTKLKSLGQLTANLAHEIRNPMSAIRHAGDLLKDGDEHDPVKTKLCSIIDTNICRIDKMLENVTALNKRDNAQRLPVNLMQFWLDFKQEFLLNNPDADGCLHIDMGGANHTVLADAMHLQQIMWNLCNNAWRHSRRDEHAVSILVRPSGPRHVSIAVIDNGAGVPPHIRNHLFEPFYTTESSGTGLGLYIAQELAHANLGQLHCRPEINGFELILPKDSEHD